MSNTGKAIAFCFGVALILAIVLGPVLVDWILNREFGKKGKEGTKK